LTSITDQFGLDRVDNDLKVHSFVETNFTESFPEQGTKQRADATWYSTQKKKRVTFAPDANLKIIHEWDDDGKVSRKSPWMTAAIDRIRFECRIKNTEKCIGHVFTPSHRLWWKSRFAMQ
jgi:hypothetical protein